MLSFVRRSLAVLAGATVTVSPVAAAACAPSSAAAAAAGAPRPHVVFRLQDPRIDEASGIAVGVRSPGVVYVQNDSGDTNRFFAVNARTGATAATITVDGARNVDWEDIATAPDAAGTPSVWLADIGDNDATRRAVQIYRVAEPRVAARAHDRSIAVPVAATWRLRYPDGPTDAESLAVAPDGTAYVVSKSLTGTSAVYRVPRAPGAARSRALRKIGAIHFVARGTPNPFGVAGELLATGAALSRDGSQFVVRTYAAAYLWPVRRHDLAGALRSRPTYLALPRERQGEGIAFDGRRLLVDSEGRGSAVDSVALPRSPAQQPAAGSGAATTGAAAPSTVADAAGSPSTAPRSPAPGSHGGGGFSVAGLIVLALLVAVSIAFRQRRRRPPPDDRQP
ncbi:MAG TPA: hypothetical protein VFH38_12600 [Jatrophihabitans sp.]|nr:hypothetical protein [Jatrophihabitans sp.]